MRISTNHHIHIVGQFCHGFATEAFYVLRRLLLHAEWSAHRHVRTERHNAAGQRERLQPAAVGGGHRRPGLGPCADRQPTLAQLAARRAGAFLGDLCLRPCARYLYHNADALDALSNKACKHDCHPRVARIPGNGKVPKIGGQMCRKAGMKLPSFVPGPSLDTTSHGHSERRMERCRKSRVVAYS